MLLIKLQIPRVEEDHISSRNNNRPFDDKNRTFIIAQIVSLTVSQYITACDEPSAEALIDGPNYNIPDSSLSASSSWAGLGPQNSRMNGCTGNYCSWSAGSVQVGDYIQVRNGSYFFFLV